MRRFIFSLQFFCARIKYYQRLRKLKALRPSISFHHEVGHYEAKTADKLSELTAVLKLRYRVFFQEFSGLHPYGWVPSYDVDEHDFHCDHLIIIEKKTQAVVACYRLRTTDKDPNDPFYTEGEFNLDAFLKVPGKKLELGRACVDPAFRQGPVLRLLWRGLCEYTVLSNSAFMFGCSSMSRSEMGHWTSVLESAKSHQAVVPSGWAIPRPMFRLNSEIRSLCYTKPLEEKKGHSLLSLYLAAGAKIGDEIAYDEEMDCVDIFTVMEFENLVPLYKRRLAEA